MERLAVNVVKEINKRDRIHNAACQHELCSKQKTTFFNIFWSKKKQCLVPLVIENLRDDLEEKGVPKELIGIIGKYYQTFMTNTNIDDPPAKKVKINSQPDPNHRPF